MKRIRLPISNMLLCLMTLGVATIPLWGQEAPDAAGHWEGSILVPGAPIGIDVDIMVDEEGIWTADISIPTQMVEDLGLVEVKVEGKTVSFKMATPGDPSFQGTLSEDGKTMAGPFTQGGAEFQFELTRSDR